MVEGRSQATASRAWLAHAGGWHGRSSGALRALPERPSSAEGSAWCLAIGLILDHVCRRSVAVILLGARRAT